MKQFCKIFETDKGQVLVRKEFDDGEFSIKIETVISDEDIWVTPSASLSFKNEEAMNRGFEKFGLRSAQEVYNAFARQLETFMEDETD